MRINLLLGILFFVADGVFAVPDASLVKRVLIGGDAATLKPLAPERARPYGKGFVREGDMYVCDNGSDGRLQRGVVWSIELNQKTAVPLMASAMAKAEGAEGSPNPDFSLYLDLVYADGTALWGQSAAFDTVAETGWHRREVVVTPDKPVRRLSCYLLCSFGIMRAGHGSRLPVSAR